MPSASLPVFVINLASAAERRERMVQMLGEQLVPFTLVEAVDGTALDDEATHFWQANPARSALNRGEIGCMLSHRGIWQRIMDEDLPGAIVLEDDLCLSASFAMVIKALNTLPEGVDLLRLEGDKRAVILRREASVHIAGHGCHVMQRSGPLGSGAYALSRQMAERLLAAAPDFSVAVDAELYAASRSSLADFIAHQLLPPIGMQAQFDQTLASDAPYLASTIAAMGARADHRLGLSTPHRRSSASGAGHMLRHIRKALLNWQLAPGGWQRVQIDQLD